MKNFNEFFEKEFRRIIAESDRGNKELKPFSMVDEIMDVIKKSVVALEKDAEDMEKSEKFKKTSVTSEKTGEIKK